MEWKKNFIKLLIVLLVVGWAWFIFVEKAQIVKRETIINYMKAPFKVLKEEDPNQNTGGQGSGSGGDSSSGGGGGSGGGSGGSGGGSGTDCSMVDLSYSLINFREDEACLQSGPSGCTQVNFNCSVEVHNLDVDSAGGSFTIKHSLLDSSQTEVDIDLVSHYVNADNFEVFLSEFFINDAAGITENYACQSLIEEVPQKEVCV